ncbi:facilitated trehalose transporter Tret1 isoform X2 [Fopius arisanus]|uniref:Facilitated trehalose transporter Tret1 isoform X2 n=1 Tax=Fopius arisanus TaxID=64838 RepID=A0A9R1U2N4_9HYME|nr:PREDICTED: facilitated trehalose transporter Tret1-like isoform X2 [Fopius arisanus]
MRLLQIHLLQRANRCQLLAAIAKDTPVGATPMTADEISWLSSVGLLMPLIILPIAAWSLEQFGRKLTGCCMALSTTLSWLIILFAQNFWQLLVSRMLGGISLALMSGVVPVYVAEISDQSMKGPLGTFISLGMNTGTLIAAIFGATLTYHQSGICGIILPPLFFLIFVFMPESPIYLVRKNKIAEATRCLMWLRNYDKTEAEQEVFQLQGNLQKIEESRRTVKKTDIFKDRATIRGFIIASGLFIGQHMTGCGIVVILSLFMQSFCPTEEDSQLTFSERSLMWLRNNDIATVDRELSELQQSLEEMVKSDKPVNIKDLFRDRATITGFVIASGLFIGQHTSGYTIVITYTALIFELANSSLAPNTAAIILTLIQLIGTWLSTMTINLTGRRSIIIISCVAMMIGHIIFGTFFLLMDQKTDVSSFSWIPLVVLSAYAVFYSMGLGPVAYVVAAEIFTPDITGLATSMAMILLWSASFLTIKFFPLVSSNFGNHVSFYILAAFCACTCIFTVVLLPETKGKSTQSIVDELNRKKKKNDDYPTLRDGNNTDKV